MTTTESKVQGFFENNRKFAETWQAPLTMEQLRASSLERGGALIICQSCSSDWIEVPPADPNACQ